MLGNVVRSSSGMTLVEVMIVGVLAAIVTLAAVAIYITSLDTWDQSGSRLALQRGADLAVEQILDDVRSGSRVEVGGDTTSVSVFRTTVSGDSLIATYGLFNDELRNQHGVVLMDGIQKLGFLATDGVQLRVRLRLEDDMGTSGTPYDDEGLRMEATAVCRNRGPS